MTAPTVRITLDEGTNLVIALIAGIGYDAIQAALTEALGSERATILVRDHKNPNLTRKDHHAIIKALYPRIPGADREAKITWIIDHAAECFASEYRFAEVVAYVRAKLDVYEAGGGTLDNFVDPKPPTADPVAPESDIPAGTKWLNADVSAWPVTAKLEASVSGGHIRMPYDKARVWPAVDGCNANPWAIVEVGGQWYACTFEYFKFGQTSKPVGVLDRSGGKGDHFKRVPLSTWTPKHGERFGIMVSGLARASGRNVKERSNVSWITWP